MYSILKDYLNQRIIELTIKTTGFSRTLLYGKIKSIYKWATNIIMIIGFLSV